MRLGGEELGGDSFLEDFGVGRGYDAMGVALGEATLWEQDAGLAESRRLAVFPSPVVG